MPSASSQSKASSTSSTPNGRNARKHGIRDGKGRFAPATDSPAPRTPKLNLDLTASAAQKGEEDFESRFEQICERLRAVEERVAEVEREKQEMAKEIWRLRDSVEEERWERKRVEDKLKRFEEEEKEEMKEKIQKEVKEAAKEMKEEIMEAVKEGNGETAKKGEEEAQQSGKYRCIVFTDSNGRDSSADLIKCHMPLEERDKYDIEVVVAYRLEDAYERVRRGEVAVNGAYVVIDNITNSIKGNWHHRGESPEEVVNKVAQLRSLILASSAAAVVVAEVKPMGHVDVRPYNRILHEYLGSCGKTGFGCKTQIRMEYLASDGTHVKRQYGSIIDRTYACALLGTHVPCPTPDDNFLPNFLRRRWESQWPRLVGAGYAGS